MEGRREQSEISQRVQIIKRRAASSPSEMPSALDQMPAMKIDTKQKECATHNWYGIIIDGFAHTNYTSYYYVQVQIKLYVTFVAFLDPHHDPPRLYSLFVSFSTSVLVLHDS